MQVYDVIIVGGGPAGLSAALVLGRCRRSVLVCDSGHPRNYASRGLHGFLSRDSIPPAELLAVGRQQLQPYGVEFRHTTVTAARRDGGHFELTLEDASRLCSRRLLIATGVVDNVPDIPGAADFYGASIFHCPYCDGWEMRDQPLAVFGRGKNAAALAIQLLAWSADIVLCTHGPAAIRPPEAERLARASIPVRQARILRFEGHDRVLHRIVFDGGESLDRRGIFLSTGQRQHSGLAAALGCTFTFKGAVKTDRREGAGIPGLWVAGDASHDVQMAIVAAAEGAKAGIAIHTDLQKEEGLR